MALPKYGPIEQGADMRRVIDAVIDAYAKSGDRIGDSDLDDEQPHPTHLPLGIVRLAARCALWRNAHKDIAEAHEAKDAARRARAALSKAAPNNPPQEKQQSESA